MTSIASIAEQFDELGLEPSPAILGRCKFSTFIYPQKNI